MDIKKLLSKQKNFDLFTCLPDAILYVVGKRGLVAWGNELACEMFEVSKEEGFLDNTINDLIENGAELVVNAEINGKALIAKSTIKEEYYELTSKLVEGGYMVALRDTTQNYKRISGILAEKETINNVTHDKNEFLYKLANKFYPPLQSIIGFSQGLIDGVGGQINDKQEKYLKIIKSNSVELSYFYNKLIELSQSESNLFEKESKYFDVVKLIEQIMKNINDNYETKSLNFNFEVSPKLKRMIYQNEPVCKIIIQNIVESIAREIEVGNIQITLSDTTEDFLSARNIMTIPSVLLTVSSLNLPIMDTEITNLFNPYVEVDKQNKNSITRALALGTAKNLAKSVGGLAWVESVSAQGPVFNVVIPREKNVNE